MKSEVGPLLLRSRHVPLSPARNASTIGEQKLEMPLETRTQRAPRASRLTQPPPRTSAVRPKQSASIPSSAEPSDTKYRE